MSAAPATRRALRAARTLRDERRAEASALLATSDAQAAIALHGTPVLLLELERVRERYRRLAAALPFVRFHYAVKANAHDGVIRALAEEGCSFDIASGEELSVLRRRGVDPARIIHTHPIKKPVEIAEAVGAGVQTFVLDNPAELDKFVGVDPRVRVLVRLVYRSPHAKSDLSSKFGVGHAEAKHLVQRGLDRGVRVVGFSFHVGSQLDDPERFAAAMTDTLALVDEVRRDLGVTLHGSTSAAGSPWHTTGTCGRWTISSRSSVRSSNRLPRPCRSWPSRVACWSPSR